MPDPHISRAILENTLKIHLRDNVKARRLLSDGFYERVMPDEDEERINSQAWLIHIEAYGMNTRFDPNGSTDRS